MEGRTRGKGREGKGGNGEGRGNGAVGGNSALLVGGIDAPGRNFNDMSACLPVY